MAVRDTVYVLKFALGVGWAPLGKGAITWMVQTERNPGEGGPRFPDEGGQPDGILDRLIHTPTVFGMRGDWDAQKWRESEFIAAPLCKYYQTDDQRQLG